jgi:acetoacetyl-CoA synthetase
MTPMWKPSDDRRRQANLTAFARSDPGAADFAEVFDYGALHRWSIDQREAFWSRVWDFCQVIGDKGERILVDGEKMPGARWFPEARLNFAENLLRDRPQNDPCIVSRDESGDTKVLTFAETKSAVAALAAYFCSSGVEAGDCVAAFASNGPEAVLAMLAAASIGAVFSSCSPDFGVRGVLDRFGQIEPKVLVASQGYSYKGAHIDRSETLREICSALPSLRRTLVIPEPGAAARLDGLPAAAPWAEALAFRPDAPLRFERRPFDHPLFILFSSGTTGAPKCIVHGAGGTLLQHLKEHQLHCDIRPGDRVFYATSAGWMMWNWLASALASRAAILLYGGFPLARDGAALFDFAQDARATFFGVSPGFLKAAQKHGLEPSRTHDLAALRLIASTGSPLAPESCDYVYNSVKADVQLASISGGTDIVSCFVLGNPWSSVMRGEIQGAGLGMAVEVWNERGARVVGVEGELVCTRAFPSMPTGFWRDAGGRKYAETYFSKFPGVWRHGDYVTETAHGGFVIHGRSDATLNPQGVRIGAADIYNVVEAIEDVEEALAVEREFDDGAGIVLFLKMRAGRTLDAPLCARIRRKLRDEASPRHVPAFLLEAPDLPHTRSGKLAELAVKDVLHGRAAPNREALANPDSLDFFATLTWPTDRRSGVHPS